MGTRPGGPGRPLAWAPCPEPGGLRPVGSAAAVGLPELPDGCRAAVAVVQVVHAPLAPYRGVGLPDRAGGGHLLGRAGQGRAGQGRVGSDQAVGAGGLVGGARVPPALAPDESLNAWYRAWPVRVQLPGDGLRWSFGGLGRSRVKARPMVGAARAVPTAIFFRTARRRVRAKGRGEPSHGEEAADRERSAEARSGGSVRRRPPDGRVVARLATHRCTTRCSGEGPVRESGRFWQAGRARRGRE